MKNSIIKKTLFLCVISTIICGCGKKEFIKDSKDSEIVTSNEDGTPIYFEKPVIYLYGFNDENVTVELNITGDLTCTYPKINGNKWFVTAEPDGTLFSKGLQYSYLYWEGEFDSDVKFNFDKGFCIKGSETSDFLDMKLKELGLNRKETEDFITYWLPIMQDNEYNVITFQTKDYIKNAELITNPPVDKSIRVFMTWYPTDEYIDIPPQFFAFPERQGRVLVEWGGAQVDINGRKDDSDDENKYNQGEIVPDSLAQEAEKQQQILADMLLQQQLSAAAGHPFTDKNGQTTTFTNEEWQKLISVWDYTGQAEEMISHHSIGELRNVLQYN